MLITLQMFRWCVLTTGPPGLDLTDRELSHRSAFTLRLPDGPGACVKGAAWRQVAAPFFEKYSKKHDVDASGPTAGVCAQVHSGVLDSTRVFTKASRCSRSHQHVNGDGFYWLCLSAPPQRAGTPTRNQRRLEELPGK